MEGRKDGQATGGGRDIKGGVGGRVMEMKERKAVYLRVKVG